MEKKKSYNDISLTPKDEYELDMERELKKGEDW